MVLQLQATSSTAIQESPAAHLVWNDQTRAMIREALFKGVSDDAVTMALTWCEMYRLNPFSRHVVILKFYDSKQKKDSYIPYITRDGVVAHAQDTGLLESIQLLHGVEMATGEKWCEAIVYRKDSTKPYSFRAFLSEWQPKEDPNALWKTQNSLWYTKPRHMLAKVAAMHCIKSAIPMSIPVLDEDNQYFHTVMAAASSVVSVGEVQATPQLEAENPIQEGVVTEQVDPAQLSNLFSDDHMPTITGETVVENPPPSAPVDDPDTLEKARAGIQELGEDVFDGLAKWNAVKLGLIRGIKSDAASIDDLSLEELAKLTTMLVAKKLGNGDGNRRM